ncbi:MAG: ChbG/HpnK family deacetylase [Phycisphaerales bacterium]|nr:ChbG/HpnK family deacetylase [Phycisphaerales bacterium]
MRLTLLPPRVRSVEADRPVESSKTSAPSTIDGMLIAELAHLRDALGQRGVTIGLSGLDGSGKSTLAQQLADALARAGYTVRTHHLYSWHSNLLRTPWLIARTRRGKPVVRIFDRGIFDNLASTLARFPRCAWLTRGLLRLTARYYPRCDLHLLLHADWSQTQARRPETSREIYTRFTDAYAAVAKATGWGTLASDEDVFTNATSRLLAALNTIATARTVILHADDLGLTYAFNEGIRRAHLTGMLTSTSLRANGWAYRQAIDEVLPACPRLGVGLHLCLNEANPVAPREHIPRLLDGAGKLRTGFAWLIRLAKSPAGRAQIEYELRAQIEKAIGDGVQIAHLDAHQHVHMIPAIFHIACRLACEYGIDAIRLTREPRYTAPGWRRRWEPLRTGNTIKHLLLNHYARRNGRTARAFGLRTPDAFVGVNYTGRMAVDSIVAGLSACRDGVVEVLLHPAIGPDPRDVEYPASYLREYVCCGERRRELAALTSPELTTYLHTQGWRPADFAAALQVRRLDPPTKHTAAIATEIRELCTTAAADNPLWVSTAQADARAFAEVVLSQAKPADRVLDLGTGSGILAICLAKAGIDVAATDVSAGAVQTAQRNARRNGVEFPCTVSDLLTDVDETFDLIAFNIPYNFRPDTWLSNVAKNLVRRIPWVCKNSGTAIPHGVLRFHRELMQRLFQQAPARLNPGGRMLLHVFDFEVGIFRRMLPASARVEVLHHEEFRAHRTVAMQITL